jgi:hypothetical protein
MRTAQVPSQRLYISRAALAVVKLPASIRGSIRTVDATRLAAPVAVMCASELLIGGRDRLPTWVFGPETRYLVLADVPEPAFVRLPPLLGLHRPDYRLFLTRETDTVRRLLVGLSRRQPILGIVDAYLLGPDLHVLTADFELRSFPLRSIPVLARMRAQDRAEFVVDEDGSYLHWPEYDIHLGVSQLLQESDPAFMVDVAIERDEHDWVGAALRWMREERSLRQTDIPGISARQVSRLERGVSRLRYEAAQRFAEAFGMQTGALLEELGRTAAELRDHSEWLDAETGHEPGADRVSSAA